ncbi:acyl-CoA thioesterase [Sphingorhabdus sp. IMCC26285]|uniref:Acyl-CoA thioesterase n=1 Tax=Sphingorhabdus profundilacus TaxID=2509718 RepID=A0A6I4LW92_9SPHN|nr:acyl-CoA thioesterase [Sphingorhabdus profundilacus]MVZ97652.1 acyl-CoA thioesterase [Sphingorhabdus profundilacus]
MPKPQTWQLDPSSYPFNHRTETRFADMDVLGHINNVSMAGLFEHGRGMFNHAIEVQRRAAGQRWLIVSVSLDYIAEAHFPEHVDVASGILRIGSSSWDIASAAFQGGACKATCITTIVLTDANGPTAINPDLRAEFERLAVRR